MERVLLCVSEAQLRASLAQELGATFECVQFEPGADTVREAFALCVVDEAGYRALQDLAPTRQCSQEPSALLLVTSRERLSSCPQSLREVDDFALLPLDAPEFAARIDRLLAARRRRSEVRRWTALREAISSEMTELTVRESSVDAFLQRGADNFARLFPHTLTVTLLSEGHAGERVVGAPGEIPRELVQMTEALGLGPRSGVPPTPQATVVIEDIEQDPRCAAYRQVALTHGLKACWMAPIASPTQGLLGTLAVYSRHKGAPPDQALWLAQRAARLAGMVLERARIRDAVRESEARVRALFDHSPLGVCLLDAQGRALYTNRALRSIVGMGRPQTERDGWLEHLHPDDRPRAREAWRRLLHEQTWGEDLTCRFVAGSREARTAHALASAVRDEHRLQGFVITLEDTTDRLSLEDQLRQSQKMEAVGRLAGGIAHDFNNLLTVVLNGVAMLQQGNGLAHDQVVAQIGAAGERAASLTAQLLAFSRKRAMKQRTVDLRTLVTDVAGLLRRVLGEQVALETKLGSREASAHVDVHMIEQVLLNLAINARDAMPEGGTIRVRLEPLIADGEAPPGTRAAGIYTRISVSDTGSGISELDLPHIFEPFYTTKDQGRGTGLGLATVYSIVQQHGGWVEVESEPGRGTTFHVCLPRVAAAVSEEAVPAPPSEEQESQSANILLVEDDPAVREMIRAALESRGYRVREAETGDAALAGWRTGMSVDLLVTDVRMPGSLSGMQLAERLREQRPTLPVVFMSGYGWREGDSDGSTKFVQKPFTLSTLATVVRAALSGSNSASE